MPPSFQRMLFVIFYTLLVCVGPCSYVSGTGGKGAIPVEPEAVIEEVNAKQLEKLLDGKDYVAVFWCKWKFKCFTALIKSMNGVIN